MRAFSCPACSSLVFFENSVCLTCGTSIGFDRGSAAMLAVRLDEGGRPTATRADDTRLHPCANIVLAECNWLAPEGAAAGLCDSCALTRTRPADNELPALKSFARTEAAKRRLVYQLDDLGLPVVSRVADPESGLAFDLLSSARAAVVTGHDNGVITIDLAEGDAGHREAMRVQLAEPYRTLLGHVRHETGHWYWQVLVEGAADPAVQQGFRDLFGDERADYGEALQRHYSSPAPPDWRRRFVSTYATAHPWEDWAETFAHLLHIRDTVQTAAAYGVLVSGPEVPDPAALEAEPVDDADQTFDDLISTWVPLTLALNQVNRSMGKDDLYPFVLSPGVLDKLRFVDALVRG
jgi:hypothetical protein